MSGTFVSFHNPPRSDPRSAHVGWIVAEDGCHLWQGYRDGHGYGLVQVDGRPQYVHRVRYEQEVGPIPEGMPLDHFACDAGLEGCCNPAHVRPVTHRENVLRGESFAAENAAKTHCPQGHPYAGDNLLRWGLRRGRRLCRECHRADARARRSARAAGAQIATAGS